MRSAAPLLKPSAARTAGGCIAAPEILPINARYWRGHFESEQAAIADFIEKTRIPRITQSRLQLLKRHGHHSVVNGKELVTHLDPLTGATVLTSFELVTD